MLIDLEKFVKEDIPRRCKVHPVYGQIAWDIFELERKGDKRFAQKNFESIRERAKLALPFKPEDEEEYEHCLDVIELCLSYHRQNHHSEDHSERITELYAKTEFTEDEIKIATSEWWNG